MTRTCSPSRARACSDSGASERARSGIDRPRAPPGGHRLGEQLADLPTRAASPTRRGAASSMSPRLVRSIRPMQLQRVAAGAQLAVERSDVGEVALGGAGGGGHEVGTAPASATSRSRRRRGRDGPRAATSPRDGHRHGRDHHPVVRELDQSELHAAARPVAEQVLGGLCSSRATPWSVCPEAGSEPEVELLGLAVQAERGQGGGRTVGDHSGRLVPAAPREPRGRQRPRAYFEAGPPAGVCGPDCSTREPQASKSPQGTASALVPFRPRSPGRLRTAPFAPPLHLVGPPACRPMICAHGTGGRQADSRETPSTG